MQSMVTASGSIKRKPEGIWHSCQQDSYPSELNSWIFVVKDENNAKWPKLVLINYFGPLWWEKMGKSAE